MSRRRSKRDQKFRKISDSDFRSSVRIGEQHGLQVTRPSPEHYQIRKPGEWIVNAYPSTGTIYIDKHKPCPPISVRSNWVLLDLITALVKHVEEPAYTGRNWLEEMEIA